MEGTSRNLTGYLYMDIWDYQILAAAFQAVSLFHVAPNRTSNV